MQGGKIIEIILKYEKDENEFIKPFTDFYISTHYPQIKRVDFEYPVSDKQHKQPDYFLVQPKILVEVKRVYDREKLEEYKKLNYNINRLKRELKSRNLSSLDGSYLVYVPLGLKVITKIVPIVIDGIINAISNNQKNVYIDGVGNFKIHKFIEERPSVDFCWLSPPELIDSPGTIKQNIVNNLKNANKQLGSYIVEGINKKILLLVNKYIFGNDISDFIEALSYSYNDLLKYQNIDEIWLQIKTWDKPCHILLYTRDFITSFDRCILQTTEQSVLLFEKWFYSLQKSGDEYKEKLFLCLKELLNFEKPYQLFSDKSTRECMVQLGNWLAEKNKYEEIIWLIDKFIDDPDPEEPENYRGNPMFNYHEKIVKGEDPFIITTVLGHLACVIQKLAVQKNYITKALDYTKKLNSHRNIYVKYQSIFPLIKIAARRQWLDGWGKRPYEKTYKEFHKIAFDLIDLVKENPSYKAIAKRLCNVFAYYTDLSTEEAEKVLDALKITNESAGLFIYFSIFRQRYYKDQHIEFDEAKFEKKLKEIIQDNNKDFEVLRVEIIWHFVKILEESPQEFHNIKPYVDLIVEKPYQIHLFEVIEEIIKKWIKDEPEVCTRWFNVMLDKIDEYLSSEKQLQANSGIQLMFTEEIIEAIAKDNPNELLEVMRKLVNLWKKGLFIRSIDRLFETFRLMSDEMTKIKIKEEYKKLYVSMKEIEPGLIKINWDD